MNGDEEPKNPDSAPPTHRLTFNQTVKLTVSIDLNDEVAEKLSLQTDDINRFLEDHRGRIFDAAQKAAGREIVELLQAYAEEFVVPASKAIELLGPDVLRKALERHRDDGEKS